tara:strand:- start:1442 stop:2056 length:615 start_codon:yes stop_codon:yes gene_type:complete
MPVSINGQTGVITGLSVGGLPDGVVDADMLAANAVASGNIASGAITAAKLASGVGGKVLQVVQKRMTGDLQTSSTSYQELTGLTQSITLASTSSKVLVFARLVQTNAYNSGTARRSRAQVYRGSVSSGTALDYNLTGSWGFSASSWSYDHSTMICTALDSPSTAGSVTYNIGVKVADSGSWYLEVYGGAPTDQQTVMYLVELSS